MSMPNKRRYTSAFYDILPAGQATAPVLSPFPGSLRRADLYIGQRVKIVNTPLPTVFRYSRESLCTVTDAPIKNHLNEWQVEVVFDRHLASEHPELNPDNFTPSLYKKCCYKDVKLAEMGIIAYSDRHWHEENFSVEYRPSEE